MSLHVYGSPSGTPLNNGGCKFYSLCVGAEANLWEDLSKEELGRLAKLDPDNIPPGMGAEGNDVPEGRLIVKEWAQRCLDKGDTGSRAD